jgi:hypothetical protein
MKLDGENMKMAYMDTKKQIIGRSASARSPPARHLFGWESEQTWVWDSVLGLSAADYNSGPLSTYF